MKDYNEFEGIHYETGTVRNILAHQGVIAPHTNKPLSEALLLGISGGIKVGYFVFDYAGHLPHVALLTRNTFDPLETLFDRLTIPREVFQSAKADLAEARLIEVLESGSVPLVWADIFSLPYMQLPPTEAMWAALPTLVYRLDEHSACIAGRSRRPLTISREELAKARGRVKQDRNRIMVLDAPGFGKLAAAVSKGIWHCIRLYTEAPPRGTKENFGFAALQHWADMLVNTRNKRGWERMFARGERMYAALAGDLYQPGVWGWVQTWGTGDGADRGIYADFLDEAAVILDKPALNEASQQFRLARQAWVALSKAVLPDHVALFNETRTSGVGRHRAD